MTKESIFRDTVARLSEHFADYVVIVRRPDGLLWRMSDRTFANGAAQRLQIRLATEDQLAAQPIGNRPDQQAGAA